MTFTRAAADEMRERIGKALSDRIEAEPGNSFLKLQMKTAFGTSVIRRVNYIFSQEMILVQQRSEKIRMHIGTGYRILQSRIM